MTSDNLSVRKRNGRGKMPLDIEKIHSMVGHATENITGVSASHVEMNSGIQFFDGISTEDIQQILIKSANDLIISGKSTGQVQSLIHNNTHSGLTALQNINNWKRI